MGSKASKSRSDISIKVQKKGDIWLPTHGKSTVEANGYFVDRIIGYGPYTKVKLAHCKTTNRQVAIKYISKKRAPSDIIDKFFYREISCFKRLNGHPNVIALYDLLETEDNIYIIMEYAEGGDLLTYINDKGHLDEEEARFLFKQILTGVSFLHDKGLVHRDIKCDNILLDNNHVVKLADFGFSTKFGRRSSLLTTFCGSYVYTAPEILEGDKYDGRKADIWSLGVVLYAMLCGRLPFKDTDLSVLTRSMKKRIHFHNKVSKDCREIVRAMLTVNPKNRVNLKDLKSMDWMFKPIDITTLSHGTPATYSTMSLASNASTGSYLANPSAEHGFTCSQRGYGKYRGSTLVTDVLKAVAVRHVTEEESQMNLVGYRKPSSKTSKIGVCGPAGRRISVQISQGQLNVGGGQPQQRRMSLGAGAPTPSERRASLRRGSLALGSSQIHMPTTALMASVTRMREDQVDKDLHALHYSTGAKVAAAAGNGRKKSAECTRRNSVFTETMKLKGTDMDPEELERIAKLKSKMSHCTED
ncbi:testis-specific serine/threonine-protein kinase 5-like [Ptychodera flava]|uniref:testis-specific serine/threonine-protein kinase 5-like n=1 Tax=Ptychodera flava TaxID=63121 RepID=UPI003969C893